MSEKLTKAQREALEILAEDGGLVKVWRRSSREHPPMLNARVAAGLADAGQAEGYYRNGVDWYAITDAGHAALRGDH